MVKTILTNCTVIICTGEPPVKDMTVVIANDRVAGLRPGGYQQAAVEGEIRAFDLEGGCVLPGLWDVHVHLFEPKPEDVPEGEAVIAWAIQGGRRMMEAFIRKLKLVFEGGKLVETNRPEGLSDLWGCT